jgi:hypothetical protein
MTNPYRAALELLVELDDTVPHNRPGWAEEWRTAIARARAALTQPKPVAPTDEEIMELMPQQMRDDLATAARVQLGFDNPKAAAACRIILNRHAVDHARAALAKYGSTTPQPVAVSERLPGPDECDEQGLCWLWERDCGYNGRKWALVDRAWSLSQSDEDLSVYTHWLPANALPNPEAQ